ncbi:MAG: restriction endonuclease subunit S [Candidatus Woesebacteria bacterium]|jgi:type I restriction enzyme S subunit
MTKQQTNYKQTEIGEIPQSWRIVKSVDVLDKIIDYRGKTPPKTNSGIPLVTAKVVKAGRIDYSNPEYITKETWKNWMTRGLPKKGDVVITTEAPLGEVAQLDTANIGLAQRLLTLRGKDGELDNTFLKYYLLSYIGQQELVSRATGSVVKGIRQSEFRKVRVLLPSYDEQLKIASVLGSLDEKIELNRKTNQTLEEMGKALFKNWFVDSEALEGAIALESLIELNPRESLKKGETTKYVEMKDLPEQGMWVSSQISKPYKGGSKFRNGDSLMARITPCLENGKSALVSFLEAGELAFGSTEYIVFRPNDNQYREYVYFLVRNEQFRQHAIKSMVGSSGRQRVQIDAIRNYKLKSPQTALIRKFHNSMEPIFQQIKINALENEKLSSIRGSLLPRLMSGKLRVN